VERLRDTLAWEVCDICHRRLPTTLCKLNGRVIRVCQECLLTLQEELSCSQQGGQIPRRPKELEVNERLLSSLEEGSKERKHTTRRTSRSRSRAQEPE
jgi:hypothetical protein